MNLRLEHDTSCRTRSTEMLKLNQAIIYITIASKSAFNGNGSCLSIFFVLQENEPKIGLTAHTTSCYLTVRQLEQKYTITECRTIFALHQYNASMKVHT